MGPDVGRAIAVRSKVARAAAVVGLAALAAGCIKDDPVDVETSLDAFSLLGGLDVGEALSLHGASAQKIVLPGNAGGADFVIVPFFGSEQAGTVTVGIDGAELRDAVGAPVGSGVSALTSDSRPGMAFAGEAPATARFHEWLRGKEIERLGPVLGSMDRRAAGLRALRASGRAAPAPAVGDIISLKAINDASADLCEAPLQRGGRVAAISNKAIIVSDTASPAELSDADFASVASEFDALVLPVDVANFGEPTDIDANGRVIIFFTPVVNDTGALGFNFAGDLFPQSECAASNEAEIVYILSPDPSGETAVPFSVGDLSFLASDIVGHETQHLINNGRRIYVNGATELEAVWLNEGLSHIAEEQLFYATTPFGPGQNLNLDDILSVVDEANRFLVGDVLRYASYAAAPTDATLTGSDNSATRGAAWAFLRYAADHEGRPDTDVFYALVNSTTSGLANLNEVLQSGDALDLMQAWTASVFSDDYVEGMPEFLTQPSWNFRSVVPPLMRDGTFPLDPVVLDAGGGHAEVTLDAGASAFFQVHVDGARTGELRLDLGGSSPGSLRVTVIRAR